ncbi:hypothetical protein CDV55_105757 [Aspergillus turcosus]|nr:hypothetical protein CDV55_105757 [Aspergillus turcosus]
MYAYASSIHSFQRRISEHQKKRWQEEQKLAAWSGPTSEIRYACITAKKVDEQSIHLVIAVRDAVYPLDFLEHRFHLPAENLDANITDFILEELRKYSLNHAERFIGTYLPTELTEMCPRLASRLWLELDVMPLADRSMTRWAEYLAMKCVRLFGPNNIPLLQVGFRGLVEVDSGFMMHLATLDDYKGTVSERTWTALERLAVQVREKKIRIALFSATPQGGGVALIRHAFLQLSKLLHLDVQWYVPQPRSGVFRITKMNHNIFQGVAKPNDYLTAENEEQLRRWVSVNSKRAWSCPGGPLDHPSNGGAHIIVVDDPQLPDLIPIAKENAPDRPVIFRSHIQIRVDLACTLGTPQARSWDWLWHRAKHADVFITHPIPDSVPPTVPKEMIGHSPASTDVLDGLNKEMIDSDIAYYGRLFNQWCHETGMPTIDYPTDEYFVQIARFDPSKGIIDVLDSYHKFHTRLIQAKPDSKIPKLVICGHGSVDDPDASEMFDMAMDHIHRAMPHLADKIAVVRARPSDQVLNAILSKSKVVLQLSTREGFEIKVSEALRKGKPVIVTDVGGLPYQVIDKETGFIVKTCIVEYKKKPLARTLIQALTARHLGVDATACHVADEADWVHGSFNLCIPVTITAWRKHPRKRVIIRFPLPYRVGEDFRPGNADEKLRCEAGAYTWLQKYCPSVPIPRLYGFGLSTGHSFTAIDTLPWMTRCLQYLRRLALAALGYPVPSRLVPQRRDGLNLGVGYLLIEYIEEDQGAMLSNTWDERHHDTKLRTNFFRSLSRILLTIARVPVPRIGSFTIDDDGVLALNNRPLTLEVHELENENIPVDIPRGFTYTSVDSYIVDILAFHDSRLRHQPNAATNEQDCVYQMSALSTMKMIFPQFFRRDLRRGPFVFCLTDIHQSNILVDADWNIKCLIDLEWACTRPIEMLHPPRWLTNQAIDEMDAVEYAQVHREFMEILENEERSLDACTTISSVLREGWERGTFWYAAALRSPTGLFRVFYDHIQPRFAKGHEHDESFYQILMYYWTEKTWDFIRQKVRDKAEYDKRLQDAFNN